MNILLVQPSYDPNSAGVDERVACVEPLSLEYLGAGIRDICDVRILDMRFDKNLQKVLTDFEPDVVGVTGFCTQGKMMKSILREAKQTIPDVVTVAGGVFVSSYPVFFDDSSADILVLGEGVFPFKEVLQKLEKKQDLSDIAGITLPDNGKMKITRTRPFPPVDTLPFPDRSLTKEHRNDYFLPIFRPVAFLRASVGCPYKCNFCLQHKMSGGKYFPRKPELVIDELKQINEPNIGFADDETFIQKNRMMHLAELIEKEGIKKRYHAYLRADTVISHPDLIERWIDIGLHRVLVGFESFKENDLGYFGKKTSVSVNTEAIHILNSLGVDYTADFIIRPEYDENDFRNLKNYVREHEIKSPTFPVLTPYPGTAVFEEYEDQLLTRDFAVYDFNHSIIPTKLPPKVFYRELSELWKATVPKKSFFERIKLLFTLPREEIFKMIKGRLAFITRLRGTRHLYKDF